MKVEYRVKPVTRYIVTRFHSDDNCGGVEQRGEYHNGEVAYAAAYALCHEEHNRAGTPPDDPSFQYPEPLGASLPA